jgi:Cu(I)/Ag(I) efflux system membrane fusion protein/cobalt-zinc-cadmium efflux system membrane fusion protein
MMTMDGKLVRFVGYEGKAGHVAKPRSPLCDNLGKASTTIAGIIVFVLGIGLTLFVLVNPIKVGLFETARKAIMPQAETAAPAAEAGGRKIKYWRAPMDATYISDKPGKSPMGMDLIPVYEDEAEKAADTAIKIDPATVQNIGVTSEPVKRGDLEVQIRTVGTLDYNEDRIFWVNTKYDGWIERVHIDYIGQRVREGESLFEIYSPDLVSTQEEYLSALRYREKLAQSGFPEAQTRADNLLEASRSRLRYWDITDEQIARLEEDGRTAKTLTVVSPVSGIVIQKMDKALEGMYAKAGMNLYKIADLSSLWVHVNVYEYQLPWIRKGQEAKIEISYYPGEEFRGKVLFFYPYLDETTRTIRVCLKIPNNDDKLRPEMFATVTFSPVAAEHAVLVPEMAVLHSGKRDVVVLDLGGGRFEPRDVKLGLQGNGQYQVLEGLEGGEKIVTSSQFLIDSESNLREAINKMLMAKKGTAPGMEPGSETKSMDQGSGTKDMEHTDHRMKPVVDDKATIEALQKILESYVPISKALVKDSTEGIDAQAKEVADAAGKAAGMVEEKMLKTQLKALEKAASEMKADSLEAARESMKGLSRALVAIFESHDVRMPNRYTIIECPMVKERWIQDTEQVSNPFMGSSMPLCGVKVGEIG